MAGVVRPYFTLYPGASIFNLEQVNAGLVIDDPKPVWAFLVKDSFTDINSF